MGQSSVAVIVAFAVIGCAPAGGGGSEPGGFTPVDDRDDVVCEVALCGGGEFALSASGRRRATQFRVESADDALEQVRQAFATGDPGAQLLIALAATERAGVDVDPVMVELVAGIQFSPGSAEWLGGRLDRVVPGWERGIGEDATPQRHGSAPAVSVGEYPLETSGCGDMALTMRLDSLTVVERVDNFANDKVYCVVQSRDDERIELVATDVSSPLRPGDSVSWSNAVFYGQEGPRDPGGSLHVRYDCWEQDGDEEWRQLREVIDALAELGKYAGGKVAAVSIAVQKAAQYATRIAGILDGDDQVFTKEEDLRRQALWNMILERERRLTASGSHLGSEYSWTLDVAIDGCAGGEQNDPRPIVPDDGGEEPDPDDGGDPPPRCEDSCRGCCVGGRCDDGNDEQACGRGGESCRSCEGLEACQGGRCVFNDRTKFDVVAVRAVVDAYKPNGNCWDDIFGRCDDPPDVRMTLASGGQRGRTSIDEDWSPHWNATILEGVEARHLLDQLVVMLEDADVGSADDLIGRCTPSIRRSHLEDGRIAFRCGQATTVVLEFPQR